MLPYYEHGGIKVYNGDCREILPTLENGCADLVVTDPPYGKAFESNFRFEKYGPITGDEDSQVASEGIAAGIRTIKSGQHLYVFGRYDFSGMPLSSPAELIWDKQALSMGNLSLPWGSAHEYIQFLIYFDSKPKLANRGKLSARLRRGSVISCPRPETSTHPTEKPILLLRQLIESSSSIGDTVIDQFAGTGSTLIAAQLEGRRAIGIEIEEKYCEIAAKRLRQGALSAQEGE